MNTDYFQERHHMHFYGIFLTLYKSSFNIKIGSRVRTPTTSAASLDVPPGRSNFARQNACPCRGSKSSMERTGYRWRLPFQSASLEAATVVVCRLVFQIEATTRESGEGLPSLCSGVVAASGFSRASYPKSELPEAESVRSMESVGQPVNSTRRYAVPVDPRATDTAYRLNYHIIWTQAVVIRLCEVIRPAHCLMLLSPQRLILIPWPLHYFDDIDFWNMNKSLSFSFMRILSE